MKGYRWRPLPRLLPAHYPYIPGTGISFSLR
jgi:hypothetical protein